jgi:hypothetical protein
MNLEFFVLILVIGIASGLIYAVVIARGSKDQWKSGKELGKEMRKGLEENWRRHVVAAVVAVGCSLPVVLLKLPLFITFVAGCISYGIADYALSKLFNK